MIPATLSMIWARIGVGCAAISVVLVVVAIAVYRMLNSWAKSDVFSTAESVGYESPPRKPTLAERAPAGTLSMSVKLRGSAYRYQPKAHLHHGEEFFRLFEDGDWKWQGQQRYAGATEDGKGAKINAAHFFAFTPSCAKLEIGNYLSEEQLAEYALVEVDGELDDMLDLTSIENVRAVAKAMHVTGNIHDIFKELLSLRSGGNKFTDVFGHYASSRGYNGIVFFSARALSQDHAQQVRESKYWDEVMEDYVKGFVYEEMASRFDRMCSAVFSGSLLTRSIKRYRFDDGPWEVNPYHGWSEEALDKKLTYNGDFLQQVKDRVSYIVPAKESESDDESAPGAR